MCIERDTERDASCKGEYAAVPDQFPLTFNWNFIKHPSECALDCLSPIPFGSQLGFE